MADAQSMAVILCLAYMIRQLFLRRDTGKYGRFDTQHKNETLPLYPDALFARTSLRLLDKIVRAGRFSYNAWNITADHVPRGAAFLLRVVPTGQETGKARSSGLGPIIIPDAVHLLLGACLSGALLTERETWSFPVVGVP